MKVCKLLSVFFSGALITGYYMDHGKPFEEMAAGDFLVFGILVLVCAIIVQMIIQKAYPMLLKAADTTIADPQIPRKGYFKKGVVAFIVIMFFWALVWLAYYPGLFNYDAWQVDQVMRNAYNKNHPLIHTLLLGKCYSWGVEHDFTNAGVALYDAIQMFVMATVYSITYVYIDQRVKRRWFSKVVLLYYALFPVHAILAISTTKDVLFTGFLVLTTVLYLWYLDAHEFKRRALILVGMACSLLLVFFFRSNAAYAGILLLVSLLADRVIGKRIPVAYMVFLLICILVFRISDGMITRALSAEPVPLREALGIPIQIIARAHEKEVDEGSYGSFFNEKAHYNPYVVDPVKNCFKEDLDGNSALALLGASAHIARKHPLISLDAFLYTSKGSWHIGDVSVSEIYGKGLKNRQGYLPTQVAWGYGVDHHSYIPALEGFYERLFSANDYQRIPVISLFFSPALYVWLMLFAAGYLVSRKAWRLSIPVLYSVMLLMTILAGPCSLVRYIYPFIASAPIYILLCLCVMRKQKVTNIAE